MLNKKNIFICSIAIMACILLASCSSNMPNSESKTTPSSTPTKSGQGASPKAGSGGYYLDDGPGDNPPANIDSIPSATLKYEQPYQRSNQPYTALGQQYTPMTSYTPYKKQGVASWYGKRFNGKKTSTGEVYDMYAMTGAHTILPIPSYAKVTNPANGRSVIVRINDRGPFKRDRLIDLSYAAAYQLRLIQTGSGLVEVEAIDNRPEALSKSATQIQATVNVQSTPMEVSSGNVAITQYYVQAGAFKNEVNGNLLQKRIQTLELGENVGVTNVYNNGLYRVRLGPFASKSEADMSAVNIRKQLNINAQVTNQ